LFPYSADSWLFFQRTPSFFEGLFWHPMILNKLLSDLAWLVYPELCAACDRALHSGETCICTYCRYHLPRTYFHLEKDNPIEKRFWGRVPLVTATAFFHFSKGEKVQRMIHRLKYKGEKEIGISVGEWMGHELKAAAGFAEAEIVLSVPLHPKGRASAGTTRVTCLLKGCPGPWAFRFRMH
jgi:predicted amidophosphoribosyltransferase